MVGVDFRVLLCFMQPCFLRYSVIHNRTKIDDVVDVMIITIIWLFDVIICSRENGKFSISLWIWKCGFVKVQFAEIQSVMFFDVGIIRLIFSGVVAHLVHCWGIMCDICRLSVIRESHGKVFSTILLFSYPKFDNYKAAILLKLQMLCFLILWVSCFRNILFPSHLMGWLSPDDLL